MTISVWKKMDGTCQMYCNRFRRYWREGFTLGSGLMDAVLEIVRYVDRNISYEILSSLQLRLRKNVNMLGNQLIFVHRRRHYLGNQLIFVNRRRHYLGNQSIFVH